MCLVTEPARCVEVRLTLSHDAVHQQAEVGGGGGGSRGDGILNGKHTHTHLRHIQEPPVPIVQKLGPKWAYTGSSQLWLLPVC